MTASLDNAESVLQWAKSARVLVVGDVMVDEYVIGRVDRMSPEAPVPVVRALSQSLGLGGAGNVARQVRVLGTEVDLVGSIGDDPWGDQVLQQCVGAGIATDGLVVRPGGTTTRKQRVIADRQQLARIDWEQIELESDVATAAAMQALACVRRPDVVIVSDYAKGFVTTALMNEVLRLADEWSAHVLVDPKSPDVTAFAGSSLLKMNLSEAEAAFGVRLGDEPEQACEGPARKLMADLNLGRVVITLGERGMVAFERDQAPVTLRQATREVFDVSGAGDTVISVLALALGSGEALAAAAVLANRAAGSVVTRTGVAVARPSDLIAKPESGPGAPVLELTDLCSRVDWWRRQGRTIVFTNGCFDLLHPGHLHLLRSAAALGDHLVVGVNGDRSVRGLKGPSRPLIGEGERASMLAAVDCVDAVVVFDEPDPGRLIDALQPDVLVKGADYEASVIVGSASVLSNGGEVRTVPLAPGWSTTGLLERLGAAEVTP